MLTNGPEPDLRDTDHLLPEMYDQLRGLARELFANLPADHTLQPTALVNEAYVRLSTQPHRQWRDRRHFYAIAARAMRRVLVDHARRHLASKRGGAWRRVRLSELPDGSSSIDVELIALDEALEKLARLNEQHCRLIELRFLGGLTVEETAAALGIAERTVRLHWRIARAWLLVELRKGETR